MSISFFNLREQQEMPEAYQRFTDKTPNWGADKAISYGRKKGYKEVGVCGYGKIDGIVLFGLDAGDKAYVGKEAKVKSGQTVFRYATRTTIAGDIFPLVKIDTQKGLLYHLSQRSSEGEIEHAEFETKSTKLRYLRILESSDIKESVVELEEEFQGTPAEVANLKKLQKAYSSVNKIDPSSSTYKKMEKLIDGMSKDQLKGLALAKIKFLSMMAATKLRYKHDIKLPFGDYWSGSESVDHTIDEAVSDWTVTVTKPVNKLKKGDAQKVKARSAFEAINKAMKLWGDPALKAAPMNSFSVTKESVDENLRSDIAKIASKYPEGSDVKVKGKSVKVLSHGKDFLVVSTGKSTMNVNLKDVTKESVDEKVITFTNGHRPDPKYTWKLMIDGEVEGEYQSLPQVKSIVKNRQKIKGIPRKFEITRHPRKKLAGPKGKLPESVDEKVKKQKNIDVDSPENQKNMKDGKSHFRYSSANKKHVQWVPKGKLPESVNLEEGKMKEFHAMVKKGMTAAQIAKKIGMKEKDVAEFMKGMDESV